MNLIILFVLTVTAIVLVVVVSSARLVQQYEQGIVFRFGRLHAW
jgi:regulator of protease activity HflC (stomatin/prohibitin superfamily)